MTKEDDVRKSVREMYSEIVSKGQRCGCSPSNGCCGTSSDNPDEHAHKLGYSEEELAASPDGANLGLGCGNPGAIAALKPGEVVVDLGSGAGFDCFPAAEKVGPEGMAIGVDMTPEMVTRACENAEKSGLKNIEFRLGELEHLPVADAFADVVMSNCVINLSPDKGRVYQEAFRVLKPGGRLAVSDTVRTGKIPEEWQEDESLHCSCISGAASVEEIREFLCKAGFEKIEIKVKTDSGEFIKDWAPGSGAEKVVASAEITAMKPGD
jgi:SAM-dependent methyltransferase